MDSRYLAFVPPLIAVLAILAGFLIRTLTHSWDLPHCWRCGAPKVRRSRSDGFLDAAAAAFLLRPFRCKGCRVRFYGLRFMEPSPV